METTVLAPEFSNTVIASAMMNNTDATARFSLTGLSDTLEAAKTPLDDDAEDEDEDDDELEDDDEDDEDDLDEDDDLEDEDDDEDLEDDDEDEEDEDEDVEDDDDPKPLRVKTRM